MISRLRYDATMMRDPLEDDEGWRTQQQDEAVREERWQVFIQVVLSFKESEGWPSVVAAVSRAMREDIEPEHQW